MIHFLYRALEAEFGIKLKVGDVKRRKLLRERLYKITKNKIEFENLSIVFGIEEDEVWIMKKVLPAEGQPDDSTP